MRKGRTIAVIASGLLGLLLTASLGGCATINVPDYSGVAHDAIHTWSGTGSESDWALDRARGAAIDKGLSGERLSQYSTESTKGEKYWWVEFRYRSTDSRSWPDRFVVRVDMNGKAKIYDYGDAPTH